MDDRQSTKLRALFGLSAVLLIAMSALGWLSWDKLPARMPIHFGASGQADGWAPKGGEVISLFVLPWVMTGLLAGIAALTPWMRKHPRWINIPNKEKFLALPPEKQAPFFDFLIEFFAWMAASLNLLFLLLDYAIIQVALGVYAALPWWGMWLPLAVVLSVAIINTIRMYAVARAATAGRG